MCFALKMSIFGRKGKYSAAQLGCFGGPAARKTYPHAHSHAQSKSGKKLEKIPK